jgi:hypothetical protein
LSAQWFRCPTCAGRRATGQLLLWLNNFGRVLDNAEAFNFPTR